jgi:hypothetical protein
MDFHHAKMNFMMELDNHIRYYRSNVVKVMPIERTAINQLIKFMTACKKLDMNLIDHEKTELKTAIGNLLYDSLESGCISKEFNIIWTTTIHQSNWFYNKCWLLCEFMKGVIDGDKYAQEEKKETDDMVQHIQGEVTLEILEDLVTA